MSTVSIHSEIAPLETIIIHRPGPEVELMHPSAAQAALFDDIIFLAPAAQEHRQLEAALQQFATVYEVTELLAETLDSSTARAAVIEGLCHLYDCPNVARLLYELPSAQLAHQLIVGTPARPSTLNAFLSDEQYALPPLHNMYFMRDAAMCVNDRVIIGAMANTTRQGEALLMKLIFQYHPKLRSEGFYFDGSAAHPAAETVEGGDVLVLRKDLVLIGQSGRTSVAGIDRLVREFAATGTVRHVIVQPIPTQRAYLHFDMVFTMLDHDLCAIHEPVITGTEASRPIHFELDGVRLPRIERHPSLLGLLADLGMPLTPILTGGPEPLHQAREQWHKGTNFFTMAPGKVIGYARNEQTYRALEAHDFRIVSGQEVLEGRVDLTAPGRVAVAMEGAELARGGGGCRCMTLPVRRATQP